LLDGIDSLEILPSRYRIHEHRKEQAKTVHAMPVPPFIVYYRVVEARHMVEVVAVLHGSRRQPRRIR
jgi:plasmid stabilization system protein ParE